MMKPISAVQNSNTAVISDSQAQTLTTKVAMVEHIRNLQQAKGRDAVDGAPEAIQPRPDLDSGRARLRDQLRSLRELAGSPTWTRLKEHADAAQHTVSRSTLAAVVLDSGSTPRWPTVAAFVDACARYAKTRKTPLPDHQVDLLTWKARHDEACRQQRRGQSPKMTNRGSSAESMATAEEFDYDVRQDGLFRLGTWSPARKLEPSRLITEIVSAENRPVQPYIDQAALAAAVEERSRTASGATVYLTGFRIDHRESDETQYCRIRQAPSVYPEVLAVEDLRIGRPELLEDCDRAVEHNVADYLGTAVPSSLAINLVVISSDNDELLCVERSAAVDSAVGWWTIGVFETMKQSDPNRPGASEDIYGLATRGLNEELGLHPGDYNPVQISWIGIYRPILRGHVVGVVKLKIPKKEVHARVRAAHSAYEHAAIEWVPLRSPLVQEFNRAVRAVYPGKVGSTIEVNHRVWLEQSRLAIQEAWRFRNAIEAY